MLLRRAGTVAPAFISHFSFRRPVRTGRLIHHPQQSSCCSLPRGRATHMQQHNPWNIEIMEKRRCT